MNAKENKDSGEQWELIERSLEDADRMIYYVSKEKAEDKNDLKCLKKLVQATAQIREDQKQVSNEKAKEHLSDFFEQITLMSHIIYPVTAESLRVMDDMGLWPILEGKGNDIHRKFCTWPWLKLIFLIFFSILIGAFVTPKALHLSLEGAFIIEKLDAALKKRAELRIELIDAATNRYFEAMNSSALDTGKDKTTGSNEDSSDPPGSKDVAKNQPKANESTNQPAESSVTPKNNSGLNGGDRNQIEPKKQGDKDKLPGSKVDISLYKVIEIVRKVQFNGMMLRSLTGKLDEWNQLALSRISKYNWPLSALNQTFTDKCEECGTGKEEKIKIPDEFKNIQGNCKGIENAGEKLLCMQIADMPDFNAMKRNLAIKNNALIILQALNSCILLLLFGCCGAIAYVLRKTIQQIHNHTFTGIEWKEFFRIILGTFTGFFLGYLAVTTDLAKLLSDEGGAPGSPTNKILSVSPWVFAFIGGYSIDILFDILNRFIYALTNDEKYLPAAEQMKRKVDVSKLTDKNNDDGQMKQNDVKAKDTKKDGEVQTPENEKPVGADVAKPADNQEKKPG